MQTKAEGPESSNPNAEIDISQLANVASQPPPKTVAQMIAEMPDEVPDPDINQFPPFGVVNRSRAEYVVELLYGPTARLRYPKKENAGQVQILLQQGSKSVLIRQASNLNDLLSEPIESYIKGGSSLQETEVRIAQLEVPVKFFDATGNRVTHPMVTLGAMSFRALGQFPEFKVRRQREYERLKKDMLERNREPSLREMARDAARELSQ